MVNQKEKKKVPEETVNEIENFISFLKDPNGKHELQEFFINLYKSIELEGVDRFINRLIEERKSDEENSTPIHKSGNVAPLTEKDLSMAKTEQVFSESLGRVKEYLESCVESDADQISKLFGSKGGFNSQIDSRNAHANISYFESRGAAKHRQELNYSMGIGLADLGEDWESAPESAWKQLVDKALEALEGCTLKADYVQNDSNSRRLILRQYLADSSQKPDEYFSIIIEYRTNEKILKDRAKYKEAISSHEKIVEKLRKKLSKLESSQDKVKKEAARFHLNKALKEMERFSALSPNPFEINEGILINIEVVTTNDYNLTRQQVRKFLENFVSSISIEDESLQEYEVDPDQLIPISKKKRA